MIHRRLEEICFSKEFGRQMRFIVGPRQTGKTTLAKSFLNNLGLDNLYYNWDRLEIRKAYRENPEFFASDLIRHKRDKKAWICFDEIHKYPKWKNALKGIFDEYEKRSQFIITGSARLDFTKYTGESLLGRYFTFHLLPVRLCELVNIAFSKTLIKQSDPHLFIEELLSNNANYRLEFDQLLAGSGFPEPLLSDSEQFRRKWRDDYLNHFIKEDLKDITEIVHIEEVMQLVELLPAKVGSLLSVNSLREDLEVNHRTLQNWLKALRLTYVIFLLSPYIKKIARSIKKEKKCYFFDWCHCDSEANRFENMIAVELFSFCNFVTDNGIAKMKLHYIRTKEKKETDFLIVRDEKPWMLFECKLSDTDIESHHITTSEHLGGIPMLQLVARPDIFKVIGKKNYVISADKLLPFLP